MKLIASSLLVLGLMSLADAAAQGRASITLFEQPNFNGRSRTFFESVGNLNSTGFNDRAMSVQVNGAWRVCLDANMKGRCANLDRDVPDLNRVGLASAISSMEFQGFGGGGRPPFPGPGPGPGPGGPGFNPGPRLDGRGTSFFPNPRTPGRMSAAEFCRRMGLGRPLYANERGADLSDVLCSR